jgi:hypothetical protein
MWQFAVNEVTSAGNQTTMLYAGPLPASEVVLPVGEFELFAEIYDEANAFAVFIVKITHILNTM